MYSLLKSLCRHLSKITLKVDPTKAEAKWLFRIYCTPITPCLMEILGSAQAVEWTYTGI